MGATTSPCSRILTGPSMPADPDRDGPIRSPVVPGCLDAQVVTVDQRPGRGGAWIAPFQARPGCLSPRSQAAGPAGTEFGLSPTGYDLAFRQRNSYLSALCGHGDETPSAVPILPTSEPAALHTTRTATLHFFRPFLRPGCALIGCGCAHITVNLPWQEHLIARLGSFVNTRGRSELEGHSPWSFR